MLSAKGTCRNYYNKAHLRNSVRLRRTVGSNTQNSPGQWRQVSVGKTIVLITRDKKAHVNMWNKADIRAVLLSNETSTAPFPRCLQNVESVQELASIFSFWRRHWSQRNSNFQRNRHSVDKENRCLRKYEYKEIFFLPPRRWPWRCRPCLLMVVGCYQTKGRKNTRSLENSAQNCKADVSGPYREKLAGQQPEKKNHIWICVHQTHPTIARSFSLHTSWTTKNVYIFMRTDDAY